MRTRAGKRLIKQGVQREADTESRACELAIVTTSEQRYIPDPGRPRDSVGQHPEVVHVRPPSSLLFSSSSLIAVGALLFPAARAQRGPDFPIRPVPWADVEIDDGFWSSRLEANRTASIQHVFDRSEERDGRAPAQLIEAAAYMLAKRGDPVLEKRVDALIDRTVAAIDGRNANPEAAIRTSGTFLEAAVEYYRATGKRTALDAAIRAADAMASVYGPGKKTYISGHRGPEDRTDQPVSGDGRPPVSRPRRVPPRRAWPGRLPATGGVRARPDVRAGPPAGLTADRGRRARRSRHLPLHPAGRPGGARRQAGTPARARLDLGGRGSSEDVPHRRHRVDQVPRAVRGTVRAPQPQRLERDLCRLRQRALEPPHVPPPRGRTVPWIRWSACSTTASSSACR